MTDAPALDDLPDPTDRTAPWHEGIPAYLAWWEALRGGDDLDVLHRVIAHDLTENYAEAVPSTEALDALAELGPLLEIGAGAGYWARLLQDRGVDVLPVDRERRRAPWTDVATGDHHTAADYRGRALFVCWPPDHGLLGNVLAVAPQRTLALVTFDREDGDGPPGGAWQPGPRVVLPTWPGRRDDLVIWTR